MLDDDDIPHMNWKPLWLAVRISLVLWALLIAAAWWSLDHGLFTGGT